MARTSPVEDHDAETRHGRSAQPDPGEPVIPARKDRNRMPEPAQAPPRRHAPDKRMRITKRPTNH
jgi:hypothetical protein